MSEPVKVDLHDQRDDAICDRYSLMIDDSPILLFNTISDLESDQVREAVEQYLNPCREWRCFHCNEVFTDPQAARDHFGPSLDATPVCQIPDLAHLLRLQEYELRRYREEDSAMARQFHSLGTEHARKVQDEEEKGYERGLKDGRGLTTDLVKQVRLMLKYGGGDGSDGYHAGRYLEAKDEVWRLLRSFPE